MRDITILKTIAEAAADFYVLGDDENAVRIMHCVERMAKVEGFPREAFNEAREAYLSRRDCPLAELPEKAAPDVAKRCMTSLLNDAQDALEGSALMVSSCNLLMDYWGVSDK